MKMVKKQRKDIEWVGGLAAIPAPVTGEGEPFRPEMLVWMSPDGVLGHSVGKPGELLGSAVESLMEAIEQPLMGRPHKPTRVRVASPELADVLQEEISGIEIVCAPTPEMDELFATMFEDMNLGFEPTYLSPDVAPEAVGAFFRAAADFFRAEPWQIVPSTQSLISVTIEAQGVRDCVLSIIGQTDEGSGFLMFDSLDEFDTYVDAIDAIEDGEMPDLPSHFVLNLAPEAELSATQREEINQHGWEVAATEAYPQLIAVGEDQLPRLPTIGDYAIAEAIALALPQFLREEQALLDAWEGGDPVERSFRVPTYAGELEVILRAPPKLDSEAFKPPYDVIAELRELGQGRDIEMDEALRHDLQDELLRRFESSPEAETVAPHWCQSIMNCAAEDLGVTIARLTAPQLRETLLEVIPRKLMIGASEADHIIDTSRAFYQFLQRELALPEADECLRILNDATATQLRAALSDPSKFSEEKQLYIGAVEAGFDMDSEEGIEDFLHAVESQTNYPSRPVNRQAALKNKSKNKAARKARKKNRRR